MKIRNLSLLALVPILIGCSKGIELSPEKYIRDVYVDGSVDDYVICNLQDLHLSTLSILDKEFDYFEKVINAKGVKPNLIVLNGDVFMDANKTIVNEFFKWLDGLNIPFVYTYGNHDLQGQYSSRYIDGVIKKCKNNYFFNDFNDNVYGDANYVLNICEGTPAVKFLKWQIYVFDSNNYHGFDYDIIHQDQVDWFVRENEYTRDNNSGISVPNLVFAHIPTEEFVEAWQKAGGKFGGGFEAESGSYYYMGEAPCNGYAENDLYEKMQTHHTKGFICGHDHVNCTDFRYNKDGNGEIRLIYGLKTGRALYHDPRLMGGTFITLSSGTTFTLERYGVNYEGETFEITNEYLSGLEYEKH